MNTPKWIVDTFSVLTCHFGKVKVEPNCDGTFYYFKWMGFYMNSGPSMCLFAGHGMSAVYHSGYDLHDFALGVEMIFVYAEKAKKFIHRVKRAAKFFFGIKIYTKEMMIASWNLSKERGY